ncbi:MAG: hypothetical protein JJU13_10235 [Balneolaceae bacterium]|nr:hypothetical protein [Balneolaceae bacterium]
MNTFITKYVSLLTVFLFMASSSLVAQQSDHQIQQNFKSSYSQLMELIDEATSAYQLAQIDEHISTFEERYSQHTGIINAALYPDSFQSSINRLRANHAEAYENITTIEDLSEQVHELTGEMDAFRNRLDEMNQQALVLQEQIERAEASEQQQAALIRQYRQNLEQRDNFVSEFLEELLTKYQRMDVETQVEMAESAERLDDNPLDVIRSIVSEYISLVDQSPGLETPDYVAMRAQHGYFNDVWERIGERLAATFDPDNPVQSEQEVDDLLAAWLASIDNQIWEAINSAFSEEEIELQSFSSPQEFNEALHSYVDAAYEMSLERNTEEDHEMYMNFRDFWNNTVKASWGDALVEGNIISNSEIAAIDLKLSDWSESSPPTSNLMFILFLVSLAVIIGLVVLLLTRPGSSKKA